MPDKPFIAQAGKLKYYDENDENSKTTKLCPRNEDTDSDGVPDSTDNCPNTSNSSQDDLDKDGKGNACDSDADGDGYNSGTDCNDLNKLVNPGATEKCSDGIDNDCDEKTDSADSECVPADSDEDGVPDSLDDCPTRHPAKTLMKMDALPLKRIPITTA